MLLRVCMYGEPILRTKGEKIDTFDEELQKLSENMIETMRENNGIGLGAQQIGEARQICVVDVAEAAKAQELELDYRYDGEVPALEELMPLVLVNPEFINQSEEKTPYNEGCLSFPGMMGEVYRPEKVHIRFQDLEGKAHELECNSLFGRAIQHEMDHLNAVLFIDHMDKRHLRMLESKLKKLKRQSRDFLKKNK